MDKIMHAFLLVIITAGFLSFESCDSNMDVASPEITVSQPVKGDSFENGDTISLHALFKDDLKLNSIEITLEDKDNIPVLASISLVPDTNPFTFTGSLIISDPLLPGGVYQLRFRASDGYNVTNRFVEIQVHELEKQLLYPLIETQTGTNHWTTYRLTSIDTWKEIYNYTGDYCGSAVNSAASQFYCCGIAHSDLTAIKLPDGGFLWKIKPQIHQSLRWFEGISFSNNKLYISCAEGNIRAYDKTGNEIYKSEIYPNAVPSLSVATKNYIVSYYYDDFSKSKMLVSFHNEGGKMIYNKFISTEVIGLHHISNDKVLVFSNSANEGEISLYNGADNTFSSLHHFYEGKFFRSAALDTENYMVSSSAGLYWFRLSNNSLVPIASEMVNCQIACDPVDQLIYASNNTVLKVFSFPSGTLLKSYSLPDPVVDLHLVFNK